jgi:hypothetical protein
MIDVVHTVSRAPTRAQMDARANFMLCASDALDLTGLRFSFALCVLGLCGEYNQE